MPGRKKTSCIDLFCGAGGLTYGLLEEGIEVVAGIDLDPACRYPYEANNGARFVEADVFELEVEELEELFVPETIKILAGCAPCQPFSTYRQGYENITDEKWGLLYEFERLVAGTLPDIVTMENVPTVERHDVFHDFVEALENMGYDVWNRVVNCADYGVPQTRNRMVLLASLHGPIEMIPPTRPNGRYRTVRQTIGHLRRIEAGESAPRDKLHVASSLSPTNLARIRASKPGGTWRDWPPHLVAACHRRSTGTTYPGVYGRMEWDKPAPTITTQCYGFGNGRFGHPEQDRAISLREAALLQSFPRKYRFVPPGEDVVIKEVGRLIGNAVPVDLGRAIGKSIVRHISKRRIRPKRARRKSGHERMRAG